MGDPRLVYDRLLARYGPQHWWPADTPFEVAVGALLMAQTSWRNVEEAIGNLKAAGALDPRVLAAMPLPRLRALVKPAGLHRSKPGRLKAFCERVVEVADGDLDRFLRRPLDVARRQLLELDGVGPETADSILLYAAAFPTFVVDAYTVRIGRRIGWFRTDRYPAVKEFFESSLPPDTSLFREYHALLVAHAKAACRPRPRCGECPVDDVCAYGRAQAFRARRTSPRRAAARLFPGPSRGRFK